MSREDKVIWSEGMFLQPQHFQQHDRYFENMLEARIGPATPYSWGFARFAIDESALAHGRLALSMASGIFPDGTPFDVPARHPGPLPLEVPATARDQLVLLAVPLRRPGVPEVRGNAQDNLGLERYTVLEHDVSDNNAGSSALIQTGQLRMRLMLQNELTDAYACLGVARLIERRQDNTLVLDRQFIAPILRVNEHPTLSSYAREIAGMLHQRGEELAAQITQPGRGGIGEIADFLLLQTVNRYEPAFMRYTREALLHPEQLYASCLQLAGDLSTFSRENRRVPAYPDYLHDDLEKTFVPLMTDLRRSLSMVLHRSAVPIDLQDRKYGYRFAQISDRDLLRKASFVLAVNAKMSPEVLRKNFPAQVKIGPVEKIRELVAAALPGIPLRAMPVAPRQIPYHAGFNYFELERGSELWGQFEAAGGMAMHVAGDFPGLELEFWGIKG
jgi:type VI secretion system protein ImpJ